MTIGLAFKNELDCPKIEQSLTEIKIQLDPKKGALKPYLVRLAGIEPTTLGFGGRYSIH